MSGVDLNNVFLQATFSGLDPKSEKNIDNLTDVFLLS